MTSLLGSGAEKPKPDQKASDAPAQMDMEREVKDLSQRLHAVEQKLAQNKQAAAAAELRKSFACMEDDHVERFIDSLTKTLRDMRRRVFPLKIEIPYVYYGLKRLEVDNIFDKRSVESRVLDWLKSVFPTSRINLLDSDKNLITDPDKTIFWFEIMRGRATTDSKPE
jgi:hypothetical protein